MRVQVRLGHQPFAHDAMPPVLRLTLLRAPAECGATKTSAALTGRGAQIIRFWLVPELFSGRPCRVGHIFGGRPACQK